MKPWNFVVALMTASLISLAACGGGNSTAPPPTSFAVGGTVAGLEGAGLVLQDNGDNNLPVSANGSFVFATRVASGSTYSVTVLTQPSNPSQNCVVANGNGTANANVTNVQVTCTTEYTIGGTVSGLATGALVGLQDNGSDPLVIGANGGFTFATPISSGTAYSVTVSTQPANPPQNCVVTNGTGIASANVTNVQITCTTIVFYTIGGTVSGLLPNANVVLLDNGTDQLAVVANGGFTFATGIASGNPYNVIVLRQPFNENCAVANATGTANANVTNVQVTCASKLKVLHSFGSAPDGSNPDSSLIFDTAGNLYGTTSQGGAAGAGAVFKLTPGANDWTETVIYSFCQLAQCADGSVPRSGLVLDSNGNLYGTTSQGGAHNNAGVVFRLSPHANGTWTESVLHSFGNGTDGSIPFGALIFDSVGNLYGTTTNGGTSTAFCPGGCGTVFELSPGSPWTEVVLYNFCSQTSCQDGNDPSGNLVFDASGNLYGTTQYGGTPFPLAEGTVFELSPPTGNGSWTQQTVYSWQTNGSNNGFQPNGDLIQDKSISTVRLLGTTQFGGGTNGGTVFRVEPTSGGPWIEVPVWSFCGQQNCTDGDSPYAGVILDQGGALYGTTTLGGSATANGGTIYKIGGSGGQATETTIYTFEGGTDGYSPSGGLVMDAAGNLYGTASGGANGNGLVFEVTP